MVDLLTKHKVFLSKIAMQVVLNSKSSWTKLIKAKYHFTGTWTWTAYNKSTGCSAIWKKICDYGPLVQPYFLWHIGVGSDINLLNDPWLSHTPLARWPAPINTEQCNLDA